MNHSKNASVEALVIHSIEGAPTQGAFLIKPKTACKFRLLRFKIETQVIDLLLQQKERMSQLVSVLLCSVFLLIYLSSV